jgi:hypothetical protein
VLFSLEGAVDAPKVIETCFWNNMWIKECFGDAVIELVKLQTVSCSGGTIADATSFVHYVTSLVTIAAVAHEKCHMRGADQGMHNYMLHYLCGVQAASCGMHAWKLDNSKSPIAILGYMPQEDFTWVPRGGGDGYGE